MSFLAPDRLLCAEYIDFCWMAVVTLNLAPPSIPLAMESVAS